MADQELDEACVRREVSRPGNSRSGERGSMMLFSVGMVIVLLFVGGVSIDLWRAFGERRALAEMADAAAAAGSNGVDVEHYRDTGVVVLDPQLAEQYAWESLSAQVDRASLRGVPSVVASANGVTVEVHGTVELSLLGLLAPGEPLEITVTADALPRRGLN